MIRQSVVTMTALAFDGEQLCAEQLGKMGADRLLGDVRHLRKLRGGERLIAEQRRQNIRARAIADERGNANDVRPVLHGSIVVEPSCPLKRYPGSMTPLDDYLSRHFLAKPNFAAACGLTVEALDALIEAELAPRASYRVREATVTSFVFGTMDAPDAIDGEYFHPDMAVWVRRVATQRLLAQSFREHFLAALAHFNRTLWRLPDCFHDNGALIEAGYEARFQSAWNHFMQGTFGLCVAHPISEHAIAHKEILQEKLTALTDNGARAHFSTAAERAEIERTLDAYAEVAMPFSPIEYPFSSRKRLVDDLRRALLL
jgi:hypothetical protein